MKVTAQTQSPVAELVEEAHDGQKTQDVSVWRNRFNIPLTLTFRDHRTDDSLRHFSLTFHLIV